MKKKQKKLLYNAWTNPLVSGFLNFAYYNGMWIIIMDYDYYHYNHLMYYIICI